MSTTHELTTRTAPDGRKVGYSYRGVTILGSDKRSTQFSMRVGRQERTWTERSRCTSIARTTAKIDYLIDGGFRTVNDEGVMV